ncbi:DUF4124 domain-containing protein [Uliginosibacterium sp. H1]|uniref:DUF4124 domain-containing protein n=1 Tax=Uliginosibacterium sp. H1 TaxID=3114757 RepID=UPI002E18B544|nr:DUF4124 domain-containing protein [Uliginosibacterium sp. H1]
MKALMICCILLVPCMSFPVQAQAYKCKQANGRVSFQDQPCDDAGSGSAIALPSGGSTAAPTRPPSSKAVPPKLSPQDQWRDAQRQREEREIREQNAKNDAYNRSVRCNNARQQLGVAKSERPIFSYNNAGERQYVDDKNRAATIAAAERRVAEDCR